MARRNRDDDDAEVEDYIIDFSKEVKSGGAGIRIKSGTYRVRIIAAKAIVSSEKETPGLRLTLQLLEGKDKGKKLPETLWATPKAYSRFRSLLEACDKKVPGKVSIPRIAASVKGCELYVEVDDEEPRKGYKPRSRVVFEGFIHPDDYDPDADDDDEDVDDEDTDDDDDEDDEPPARSRKKKSSKKTSTRDDDEDEDDDLDLDDL